MLYPVMNEEGANSVCQAVEMKVMRTIEPQKYFIFLVESKGQMATTKFKTEYPELPASIACTMAYFALFVNPNYAYYLSAEFENRYIQFYQQGR
jgi:hypothetical protein